MANKKVSQLPEHLTLVDTDLMYVAAGAVSKKVKAGTVKTWITSAVDFTPIQTNIDTQIATMNTRITNDIAGVVASKQNTLVAGSGIVLTGNTISVASGGGTVDLTPLETRMTAVEAVNATQTTDIAGKQNTLVAGTNISIVGNTISAASTDLTSLESRVSAVETGKQNTLVAGSNITIVGNTISAASGGGGSSLPEPVIIQCGYYDQAFPTTSTLVGHQMFIGNISFNRANIRATLAVPLDIASTDIISVDLEIINTLTGATVETLVGFEFPGFFRYQEQQNVAFTTTIFPGMHSFVVRASSTSAGTIARGLTVYFDGMTTV